MHLLSLCFLRRTWSSRKSHKCWYVVLWEFKHCCFWRIFWFLLCLLNSSRLSDLYWGSLCWENTYAIDVWFLKERFVTHSLDVCIYVYVCKCMVLYSRGLVNYCSARPTRSPRPSRPHWTPRCSRWGRCSSAVVFAGSLHCCASSP